MAHVIELALDAVMSRLSVKGPNKSWETHECDQQFGQNVSINIRKSPWLQNVGHATMDKVSAMRQGLSKIIEKVHLSWYFESTETVLNIAENTCSIVYVNTWSLKQVLSLSSSQTLHYSTWYYGCEDTWALSTRVARVDLPFTGIHTRVAPKCKIHWLVAPLHNSRWMDDYPVCHGSIGDMSNIGPSGCLRLILSHCITSSQCTITCSITWLAWCELWPRRRHNGMKTCSSL
jgi:hypothetical protein